MTPRYLFALRWRLWLRWVQARQRWRYGHIPRWQLYTLWRHIAAEHEEEDQDD